MIRLEVEDDSDCATCTQRHRTEWEMLAEVKCDLLQGLTCQECGRPIAIFVEGVGPQGSNR